MKVRIHADRREVEVETADVNVTPEQIIGKALDLWRATARPDPPLGSGFGLTTERSDQVTS